MLPKAVTQYLQANRQKHLDKLFELLRIPSIANNDDGNCERAVQWLRDYLEGIGAEARIVPTPGKPLVLGHLHVSDDAPTILIYGHYDVQPGDPLDQWVSPPFEPEIRDGWIYARGADDDKGQLFAHMMAIEAWQAAGECPVNIKLLIEGEEEIASPNLEPLLVELKDELTADTLVISDSAFFSDTVPAITSALRGIVHAEIFVDGPRMDLHSGLYGGMVANPTNGLARLLARMHDDDGRVTLNGFYDDVLEVTDSEREAWAKLGFDEAACAKDIGLDTLAGGERNDFPPLERNWARPALDCNGIIGGFTGEGTKTVIPTSASAKLTIRLVANQDPDKIVASLEQFIAENTHPGLKVRLGHVGTARPVLLPTDTPAMESAKAALSEAFGRDATFIRCGASVPATELFQRIMGLDAVMMGFGLGEDALHSPNEKFRLTQLYGGSMASAAFMQKLGQTSS